MSTVLDRGLRRSGRPEPRAAQRRTLRSAVGWHEVAAVVVFLSSVAAPLPLGPMSFYIRTFLLPGLLVLAWLMAADARQFGSVRIDPTVLLFLAWLAMAFTWSRAPQEVATQTTMLLVAMTLSTHLGGAVFDQERLLRALAFLLAVVMAAVAFHTVTRPGVAFSVHNEPGFDGTIGLRSFFYHKNSLGMTLALGVALLPAIRSRVLQLGFGAGIVVLLSLSTSSTAWVASVAVLVVTTLIGRAAAARRSGSRGGLYLLANLAIVLVVGLFVARNVVLQLLGRDPSITGRDAIWRYSWRGAMERPWLGYGVEGFWAAEGGGPAYVVRRVARFEVPTAHQGLLDIMIDYGLVGVVLYLAVVAMVVALLWRRILAGDAGVLTRVTAGFLTVIALVSLTESNLQAPGLAVLALSSALLMNNPVATSVATASVGGRR